MMFVDLAALYYDCIVFYTDLFLNIYLFLHFRLKHKHPLEKTFSSLHCITIVLYFIQIYF